MTKKKLLYMALISAVSIAVVEEQLSALKLNLILEHVGWESVEQSKSSERAEADLARHSGAQDPCLRCTPGMTQTAIVGM